MLTLARFHGNLNAPTPFACHDHRGSMCMPWCMWAVRRGWRQGCTGGKHRSKHSERFELSVAHHGERDKLPTLEHQTGRSYYRRLFFRSSTSCSSSHSQRRKITILSISYPISLRHFSFAFWHVQYIVPHVHGMCRTCHVPGLGTSW